MQEFVIFAGICSQVRLPPITPIGCHNVAPACDETVSIVRPFASVYEISIAIVERRVYRRRVSTAVTAMCVCLLLCAQIVAVLDGVLPTVQDPMLFKYGFNQVMEGEFLPSVSKEHNVSGQRPSGMHGIRGAWCPTRPLMRVTSQSTCRNGVAAGTLSVEFVNVLQRGSSS